MQLRYLQANWGGRSLTDAAVTVGESSTIYGGTSVLHSQLRLLANSENVYNYTVSHAVYIFTLSFQSLVVF